MRRPRVSTIFAALTAVVAWLALGLQLVLIVEKMTGEGVSVLQAIWRFFGFFTILTNCGVAIVATAIAMRPNSFLANANARLSTVTAISIVGLVYSVALRAIWQPTGWQAVVDHGLHDVTPVLYILTWFFSGHGQLQWRNAVFAVVPALVYFVYALVRGAGDGWYAYWFLDPTSLPLAQMAINIAILLLVFSAVALGFVSWDKWLARNDQGLRRRLTIALT